MTKENKLALVVGFALILFVGILVSDHFSAARTQQSADLLPASDPLIESGRDDPQLLRFEPPTPARTVQTQPPEVAMRPGVLGSPENPPETTTLAMPDLQAVSPRQPRVALTDDDAESLPFRFHHVSAGESLSSISTRYYGDNSLARELAAFNAIPDPDRVHVGTRLRIPSSSALIRGAPPAPASPAAAPPASDSRGPRTYTVKSGDVLSIIAQRQMGSARRWRDLYEHNRDVIDDPDHVEVGTVLKIPTTGG